MTKSVEVPSRPEQVLDDDRIQYQAMTDLSNDEYRRLAEDIRERGVLQPIITDESGTILDGHHRAALAEHLDLDESREPAYVVVGDLEGDSEKFARAIKQNVLGRDTTDAVMSHAVKQYIEATWDRTDDGDLIRPETDTEVAKKLGVSEDTVGRVFDESAVGATVNVIKKSQARIIYHDRVKAREYYGGSRRCWR
jgi:ParB-like chromosome segregation protein Spo0J